MYKFELIKAKNKGMGKSSHNLLYSADNIRATLIEGKYAD